MLRDYRKAKNRLNFESGPDQILVHSRSQPPRHAPITGPARIAELMRAIDGYSGQPATHSALKLAPLVFVRPGELREAEWKEIDLDNAKWRIPAHKMRMCDAHVVPLSRQAIEILREIQPLTGSSRYVFPSLLSRQRAINRASRLAERRKMMQVWADYLDRLRMRTKTEGGNESP